jgi:hypothetical protein
MDATTVEAIATVAPVVAAEYEAARAAKEAELAAEAALMKQVYLLAKPALRALSRRPRVRETTVWVDNVSTHTTFSLAPWSGLWVSGGGVSEDHSRANAGAYEGEALYLLTTGEVVALRYSGHWSRWQGADRQWESTEERLPGLTTEEGALALARRMNVEELVGRIAKALKDAAGSRTSAIAASKARLAKLEAVTALLKK